MLNEKENKVISAARLLFHRHGLRRVTMNDIAVAAEMSRPALYLIFPNKETIFEAVVRWGGAKTLDEIRQGVAARATVEERLRYAFELWTVRPYEMVRESPDARDLLECRHGFAGGAMIEFHDGFEHLLSEILEGSLPTRIGTADSARIAHLLTAAASGFKTTARSVDELRELLNGQISLLLASLPHPRAALAKTHTRTAAWKR